MLLKSCQYLECDRLVLKIKKQSENKERKRERNKQGKNWINPFSTIRGPPFITQNQSAKVLCDFQTFKCSWTESTIVIIVRSFWIWISDEVNEKTGAKRGVRKSEVVNCTHLKISARSNPWIRNSFQKIDNNLTRLDQNVGSDGADVIEKTVDEGPGNW